MPDETNRAEWDGERIVHAEWSATNDGSGWSVHPVDDESYAPDPEHDSALTALLATIQQRDSAERERDSAQRSVDELRQYRRQAVAETQRLSAEVERLRQERAELAEENTILRREFGADIDDARQVEA